MGLSETVSGDAAILIRSHDVLQADFPGSPVSFRGELLALGLSHAAFLQIPLITLKSAGGFREAGYSMTVHAWRC